MSARKLIKEKIAKLKPKTILHLGAGKVDPDLFDIETKSKPSQKPFVLNVDQMYIDYHGIGTCSAKHKSREDARDFHMPLETCIYKSDVFQFLEGGYPHKFDMIVANRIFEHFFYDSGEIGRALAGCHNSLKDTGTLLILVPDHDMLADSLVTMKWSKSNPAKYAKNVLLLNTEFCNTRVDPHGSIWTSQLAKYYIETEGVWDIKMFYKNIGWQGRECYMMIELTKKPVGDFNIG